MEANLPVEEQLQELPARLRIADLGRATRSTAAATTCHGIQTIAFNLPNDERVREAKGAKKVILRNVLGAKYDRILKPMAGLVLVPEQAGQREQALHVHGDPVPRAVAQPRAGIDHGRTAARPPSTRS